jgi:hypothetical protein
MRMEKYIIYPLIEETGLAHSATSTINTINEVYQGVPDEEKIEKLCEVMGFNYNNLATCGQVHSSEVEYVDSDEREVIEFTDALITDVVGKPIGIFTADCVPGVILDVKNKAIGIFHAGWRGTRANIAQKTIIALRERFDTDATECVAVIGPSIGPCCYSVEEDVSEKFIRDGYTEHLPRMVKGYHLDLPSINIEQLINIGFSRDNIDFYPICTYEAEETFYSFRRQDDVSGRMITMISLNP